ncbi:hypothetical protein D3C81_1597410 [compost metagenome]
MLLRMMCEEVWPTSSSPRYLMLPLWACGEPHRVISRVDLPAPLAPIKVTISPWLISTLTLCSAWILP